MLKTVVIFVIGIIFAQDKCDGVDKRTNKSKELKEHYNILSLDGGGVRGLIAV